MPKKKASQLAGYEGKRLTPLAAIRSMCRSCMGNGAQLVADCVSEACPLHPYRSGAIEAGASRRLLRVIKTFCATCAADSDAAACTAGRAYLSLPACPLWPYRLGRSPFVSAEVRERRRELGLKYGFGAAQEPVSRARIDGIGAGDSPGHPGGDDAEHNNTFAPIPGVGLVQPAGWCGQL